jgi:hypothetical protein
MHHCVKLTNYVQVNFHIYEQEEIAGNFKENMSFNSLWTESWMLAFDVQELVFCNKKH